MKTIHQLIRRISNLQANILRPSMEELGLGIGQPRLLSALSELGDSSQKELSDYLCSDPASVSRMVELLSKNGFVRQERSESDRRANLIAITDKGFSALEKWRACCLVVDERELDGFSEEERATVLSLLERVLANLEGDSNGRA